VALGKTLFAPPRREGAGGQKRTARPLRLLRQAGGRLSWGVADQAMSSLSNFAVSIYIARTLGAAQFGAFSIAYVTYGFALQVSRGLTTDPLLVRFSGTDIPTWRRAIAPCTGAAALTGLATGAGVLAVAALLHGPTRLALLALGLTLPALLLQDSWRFAFFALGRGSQAFLNDTLWTVTLLPALVLLRMTGHANVFWFVFAWGVTAGVGAAVGPLQARVVPTLLGAWSWLSQHRDLGVRYVVEGSATSAAAQLRNSSISAILGLAAIGYLQAANTLMGPFQVILYGMGLVALPEAARILRRSPRHMGLFCVCLSVALTLLALAWGGAMMVALPRGLGDKLLGPIWRPTYPLVLPTALFMAGGCASAGAGTWLHALGAARRSMRAATITAGLALVLALIGAETGGTRWTVGGAALGAWLGSLLYWWQVRAAQREFVGVPAADQSWSSHPHGQRGSAAEPAGNASPDRRVPSDAAQRAAAFASAAAGWSLPPDAEDATEVFPRVPLTVPLDPAPWAAVFSPAATRWSLPPGALDRTEPLHAAPREPDEPPPPWREKMPPASTGARDRRIQRRVSIAWGLLVVNALGYTGMVVHIPSAFGKAFTQGALPLALIILLSVNRKVTLRPNVFLCLVTLLAIEAFVPILQPQHFGTIYRVFRFAQFVIALWLLTPWWGRRDLLLVRCHLTSLSVIMASVGLGVFVAPGRALGSGRLSGALWDIPPTQVAHYAAIITGLVVILWVCGRMRGRPTLFIVGATVAVLLATHTRTALLGCTAGLLVAGLSLIAGSSRVRKLFAAAGAIAAIAILTLSSFIASYLARGEGTQQLTNLTGRTVVWSALVNFPRDKFQMLFGFGLSNDSFNGLAIDSNWLASYQGQGLIGVGICVAMLVFLLLTAYFQPRGAQRALALFLITYCLVGSFTEVGITNATPYLLELTLAASLVVPSVTGRRPA
jgi:O-antigen/teichoic acid export membrane protein